MSTLRASNHILQNDASGLVFFTEYFCYSLQVVFLSFAFWGWSCLALLSSIGIQLGLLYTGRGVAIGPNILWSTPFPTQESTFGVTSREFPWTLKQVVFSKHILQSAKCVLHCTPPESDKQARIIRHTGQPMHPGCWLAQCLLTTQSFDTSREVGSWWFECCI